MDYNNPLSPWNQRHYNDKMYDEMTDDEKMKADLDKAVEEEKQRMKQ